jgi:lipopolysaccharide/colanic/teichoic acid biosynthesis glycosyltransferase
MLPAQAIADAEVISVPAGFENRQPQTGDTETQRLVYARLKRVADIVFVMIAGPGILLVIALAALAIAITMGRPVFFFNERVGRGGRIFKMVKLRTMSNGGAKAYNATLKNDPRITPLGSLLRRTHIDELPQIWNILGGDMTMIGPRPEQPHLVEYYRDRIANYDLRHTVTPGLSGWSQVCFGYATDLEETKKKLSYDLEYIERFGPRIDFEIVLRTLRVYLDPNFVR